MNKAWQYGARNLWVLNVGDIKPGEIGTEFFLDMAWDPQRYRHDNVRDFLVRWAARDLDPRFADEIAVIMEEYYRLGFTRRPEHLVQAERNSPLQYSWFSHTEYNDEAMQRVDQYDAIARRAQAIYDQLPTARKDAFFQLVLYPVQCASLMNRKVIFADKSTRHGNEGRACASEDAAKARAAAARIIELTDHYNTGLVTAGNKWNHMMSPGPGSVGHPVPPIRDAAAQRFRRHRPAGLGRGARRRRSANLGRLERLYPGQALRRSLQHRQGRDPLDGDPVATVGAARSRPPAPSPPNNGCG